jgi:hypothetical protein
MGSEIDMNLPWLRFWLEMTRIQEQLRGLK